jgi:hypothetical protein
VSSFHSALERIKGNVSQAIPASLIHRITQSLGLVTRERQLTPVVTTHLAVQRCLHGGTAITHLRRFTSVRFSPSAYCQAIDRLPVAYFGLLSLCVTDRLRSDREADRWHGHRVFLLDGSGLSMPDTPALQAAFGQPSGQKPGCGFPVAHLLAMFDHRTGYLVRTTLAPLATHDLAHAAATHHEMQPGDLLLADRAFGSFAHLALLQRRGLHGLFRLHQRRPHGTARDRIVVYAKPKPPQKPSWMTDDEFATLPDALTVREVKVTIKVPGCRVRSLVLVTTLLDRDRYPAKDLAKLYEQRWQVEGHLRSLKISLGMDVLKSQTVEGVKKEVLLFAVAYNLVRKTMQTAADQQHVPAERISFTDALRWLLHARPGEAVPLLLIVPHRPGRWQPRVRKRRPKQYRLMTKPRGVLRKQLKSCEKIA